MIWRQIRNLQQKVCIKNGLVRLSAFSGVRRAFKHVHSGATPSNWGNSLEIETPDLNGQEIEIDPIEDLDDRNEVAGDDKNDEAINSRAAQQTKHPKDRSIHKMWGRKTFQKWNIFILCDYTVILSILPEFLCKTFCTLLLNEAYFKEF